MAMSGADSAAGIISCARMNDFFSFFFFAFFGPLFIFILLFSSHIFQLYLKRSVVSVNESRVYKYKRGSRLEPLFLYLQLPLHNFQNTTSRSPLSCLLSARHFCFSNATSLILDTRLVSCRTRPVWPTISNPQGSLLNSTDSSNEIPPLRARHDAALI